MSVQTVAFTAQTIAQNFIIQKKQLFTIRIQEKISNAYRILKEME